MLEELGERIGRATNNVAEYRALLRGIELAAAHGATELELVGDSELVVRQVEGRYKVKDATMQRAARRGEARRWRSFERWSIRHVRREARTPTPTASSTRPWTEQAERCRRDDPIDPGVDIGHVHLKVADVDRALDFYCGVLGFELMQRYGDDAAFISAGGYHHHIGLNSWESKGGSPPPPGTTGLFHTAIRYPTRRALADALRRVIEAGVPLTGASDHGVSEALYLDDPDGNGRRALLGPPARRSGRSRSPAEGRDVRAPARPRGLLAELN